MRAKTREGTTKSSCVVGDDVFFLFFAQARWARTEAKAWAKDHGFKHGVVKGSKGLWILPQQDESRFVPRSFRQVRITDDVRAMVGCPR